MVNFGHKMEKRQ